MIDFINKDSKAAKEIKIDIDEIIFRLDFLIHKAFDIPVYLVSPETMDKLYPLQKRRGINKEIARRLIHLYKEVENKSRRGKLAREKDEEDKEKTKIDEIFERIWEEDSSGQMIAVGLYIHHTIYICPERVIDWANRLSISENLLFQKVYYHELGHAFIYEPKRKYNLGYYRLLEESYCNAVALSRFTTKKEISQVIRAIFLQPLEYRGYSFFYLPHNKTNFSYISLYNLLLKSWFENPHTPFSIVRIVKDFDAIRGKMFEIETKIMENWFRILNRKYGINATAFFYQDIFTFERLWRSETDDEFFKELAVELLEKLTL